MTILGVDLGATNTKMILLGDGDTIEHLDAFPTGGEDGHDVVIERLVARIRDVVDRHSVEAVGIGTPGLFDEATGVVTLFTNLPGQWIGVPFRRRMEDGLGMPVTLINDARAFVLAEGTLGAGRGASVVAGLTLGTGVGGGIMIDGKLHRGAHGIAGELAHQTVDVDGGLCGCGNRGCAEAAARQSELTTATGRRTLEEVFHGYAAGDEACVAAVEKAASALGRALANAIAVIDPEVIVVGGAVTASMGADVLDPIRAATLRHVTLIPHDAVHLVAAELGGSAGAIGAALAARG